MEYKSSKCRSYTLPVLSSNFEIPQPATSANPVPYKYSLNSISSSGFDLSQTAIHQKEKQDFGRENNKWTTANNKNWEVNLPDFNPQDDLLYLASTFTDRYLKMNRLYISFMLLFMFLRLQIIVEK